jgi:cobalt transporter subunit CbtA
LQAFRRIVFSAALAGLVAGVLVTLLHHFGTVALILQAEVYEKAADAAAPAASETAAASSEADMQTMPEHAGREWEPAAGFERTAFTLLADVITGVGYALLLVAGFALRGGAIDWRGGLYWGLAGFVAFALAPALGLPPELPGTESAPLLDRQIWWVATAAATAGGLALIFFAKPALWALAGLLLIAVPHIYGAPQPAEHGSLAPESLEQQFVVAALVTSLLFWAALGSLSGHFYKRFGRAA